LGATATLNVAIGSPLDFGLLPASRLFEELRPD